MNTISLSLTDNIWYATYSGEHAVKIKDLFGTISVPTPYTGSACPKGIKVILERKNPGVNVIIN